MRHAGGMMKKPDATPQDILSDQLALCTEALRESFEGVRAARAGQDPNGYRRVAELNGAIAILAASANVGLAVAKINGEFRQDITVRRGEGGAKSGGSNG